MNQVHRRLNYLFLRVDSVYLALISGLISLLFGFILGLPAGTFSTSMTYQVMSDLLPEVVWGLIFFMFGLWQVLSAFFNYHWRIQAFTNLAGLFLWSFIAIMFLLSNPITSATSIFPVLAALCLGRAYRCYQDKERL